MYCSTTSPKYVTFSVKTDVVAVGSETELVELITQFDCVPQKEEIMVNAVVWQAL